MRHQHRRQVDLRRICDVALTFDRAKIWEPQTRAGMEGKWCVSTGMSLGCNTSERKAAPERGGRTTVKPILM